MKKLFIFLLLVSVILMLVFNSSYKKNPHLSKINDDVSIAKMKIKEKSYFDDSEIEEKIYGDEEEKLLLIEKNLFANARNIAAGTIRQKDVNIVRERNLKILIFFIYPNNK